MNLLGNFFLGELMELALLPFGAQRNSNPNQTMLLCCAVGVGTAYVQVGYLLYWPVLITIIEEKSHRSKGKGRHCWLGDGIVSIECRTRDLAPG